LDVSLSTKTIKTKDTIKQIQTEKSKGLITKSISFNALGGGVMNVTEVMICGLAKLTTFNL
jgi:hypothetical protein